MNRVTLMGVGVGSVLVGVLALLVLIASGVLTVPPPAEDSYNHTPVTITDENGTQLGTVDARIADTAHKRYTGLSNTHRLAEDEGMLFIHDAAAEHTYVMRNMSFGIDIVFADANGRITTIHHAPKPPAGADGNEFRYPGHGKYVLEVNQNWTTRHGVTEGDRISIDGRDP